MKKFLSLLITVLCALSAFAVQANACVHVFHETKVPDHLLED